MSGLKIPFALYNGRSLSIEDYNGEKDLTCHECGEKITYVNGYTRNKDTCPTDVREHFTHGKNGNHQGGESYEHKLAKNMVATEIFEYYANYKCCKKNRYTVKLVSNGTNTQEEYRWNNYSIDVAYLENSNPSMFVEIYNTHRCEQEKLDAFNRTGVNWLEIKAKDVIDAYENGSRSVEIYKTNHNLNKCVDCQRICERYQRIKENICKGYMMFRIECGVCNKAYNRKFDWMTNDMTIERIMYKGKAYYCLSSNNLFYRIVVFDEEQRNEMDVDSLIMSVYSRYIYVHEEDILSGENPVIVRMSICTMRGDCPSCVAKKLEEKREEEEKEDMMRMRHNYEVLRDMFKEEEEEEDIMRMRRKYEVYRDMFTEDVKDKGIVFVINDGKPLYVGHYIGEEDLECYRCHGTMVYENTYFRHIDDDDGDCDGGVYMMNNRIAKDIIVHNIFSYFVKYRCCNNQHYIRSAHNTRHKDYTWNNNCYDVVYILKNEPSLIIGFSDIKDKYEKFMMGVQWIEIDPRTIINAYKKGGRYVYAVQFNYALNRCIPCSLSSRDTKLYLKSKRSYHERELESMSMMLPSTSVEIRRDFVKRFLSTRMSVLIRCPKCNICRQLTDELSIHFNAITGRGNVDVECVENQNLCKSNLPLRRISFFIAEHKTPQIYLDKQECPWAEVSIRGKGNERYLYFTQYHKIFHNRCCLFCIEEYKKMIPDDKSNLEIYVNMGNRGFVKQD